MLDVVFKEPYKHGIVYSQMFFDSEGWVYWALNSKKVVIILILYSSSSGLMLLWQILDKLMGIRLLEFEIIIFLSEISSHYHVKR